MDVSQVIALVLVLVQTIILSSTFRFLTCLSSFDPSLITVVSIIDMGIPFVSWWMREYGACLTEDWPLPLHPLH